MLVAEAGEVNLTQFWLPRCSGAKGLPARKSLMEEADNDKTDDEFSKRGALDIWRLGRVGTPG